MAPDVGTTGVIRVSVLIIYFPTVSYAIGSIFSSPIDDFPSIIDRNS